MDANSEDILPVASVNGETARDPEALKLKRRIEYEIENDCEERDAIRAMKPRRGAKGESTIDHEWTRRWESIRSCLCSRRFVSIRVHFLRGTGRRDSANITTQIALPHAQSCIKRTKGRTLTLMTKAPVVEAPSPYPGIKQAKIAKARANSVMTSSAMAQISLIREGAPAEIFKPPKISAWRKPNSPKCSASHRGPWLREESG
jgi:hypothetical protein